MVSPFKPTPQLNLARQGLTPIPPLIHPQNETPPIQPFSFPMMRSNSDESDQLNQLVKAPRTCEKSSCFHVQVTFLNKICRVHVFSGPPAASVLKTIIHMLINHFCVKLDQISTVHLISTESSALIWSDSQLELGASYFICFARKGFRLTLQGLQAAMSEMPELVALLGKPLFARENRSFRVTRRCQYQAGMVEELQLHQSKSNQVGFICPFVDCAAQFRKSCDLVIHFNVETGNKPYICQTCGQGFRRNILLKHHLTDGRCTQPNSRCPQLSPLIAMPTCLNPIALRSDPAAQTPSTQGEAVQSPVQGRISESCGSPSPRQLQLQVGQIFKTIYLKLQKLEIEGAPQDEIIMQKLKMCWEFSVTSTLLRGGA